MQLLFLGAAIDCWCYECSFSFSFTFLCELLPKKESELLALYTLNELQMTFHLHQRHVTEILSGTTDLSWVLFLTLQMMF